MKNFKNKITFIAITTVSIIFFMHITKPYDFVDLNVHNVPQDIDAIFILTKNNQLVSPLNWYESKLFPHVNEPKRSGQQWLRNVTGSERRGTVQWKAADAYGVLARRKSAGWVVWWLDPHDVDNPTAFRYIFGGGSTANIRISNYQSATPAPQPVVDKVNWLDP